MVLLRLGHTPDQSSLRFYRVSTNWQQASGGSPGRIGEGIVEIIGGSQREERLEVLDQAMAERGIDKDEYGW